MFASAQPSPKIRGCGGIDCRENDPSGLTSASPIAQVVAPAGVACPRAKDVCIQGLGDRLDLREPLTEERIVRDNNQRDLPRIKASRMAVKAMKVFPLPVANSRIPRRPLAFHAASPAAW